VSVWDGVNKKRLVQYPQYPTSIASLAFKSDLLLHHHCLSLLAHSPSPPLLLCSHDGSVLAIASSYTFEEGEKPPSTTGLDDMVFLRRIQEDDVRPRPKVQ
jgi:cell cycle arrest protein BUB3